MTYVDIAGLDGSAGKTGIPDALLNQLTQMDGFIQVVRVFEDENVPHMRETVDAARDIQSMDSELVLNDLISVERKLERLEEEKKKGAGREKALVERETGPFRTFSRRSFQMKFHCGMWRYPTEEEKLLSGFGFLSRKPMLIVLNCLKGKRLRKLNIHTNTAGWWRCRVNWKWILPSFRLKKPRYSLRNTVSRNPA